MPIIGSEPVQKCIYRLTITLGGGIVDNVLITPDGLYSVYFIKDGRYYNATGRIPKVIVDYRCPQNSYILFDYSSDRSAKRERIFFPQVQLIKDVTPNSAYKIAVEHGFEGTVEDWLSSMKGDPGKSAYEIAVDCGFSGTEEEWLASLKGNPGEPGKDGKSAYEIAVEHGFSGTEEEWLASLGDVDAINDRIDEVENKVLKVGESVIWVEGMGTPDRSVVEDLLKASILENALSNASNSKTTVTKIIRA